MAVPRNIYFGAVLALAVFFQLFGKEWLLPSGLPFHIVDVEGRGKGLRAIRDISQGQLVLTDYPLFILEDQDLSRRLPSALSNLNQTVRETFFQLSFPSDTPISDIPEAIWRTNAIADNGNEMAILPLMSRVNHGCSHAANAVLSWRDGHAVLHAIRPIKKGEEILREYVPTKLNREARRELLRKQYGFHCTCSVCTLPPVESGKSDIRLSSIAMIEERIYGWSKLEGELDPDEIARLAKHVWGLGDMEGYWIGRGRLAEEISALAAAHHDANACSKWAQLASEWYGYEFGYNSIPAVQMKRVSLEPSRSAQWASRTEHDIEVPDM